MSKIVKTWDGHQGELLYIKGKIAFIKESNGEVWFCLKTDIIDFDEINMEEYYVKDAGKITYIYGVDLEEHIRVIEKLQSQLDQQKAMWNELKELVIKYADNYDESISSICYLILEKMQELEKVKEEMDLNGNSYCEIRQGTSPHNPTDYAWFNYVKFRNYLNQQIKELKGERNERKN